MVMIIFGGLVRLTKSGLSMVEWSFTGSLPPFSEEGWLLEFGRYRMSPEYQKLNSDMTLAEFKSIFWMEYTHRMLGRLTGLVYLVPFLIFLVQRKLRRKDYRRYGLVLFLFGIQGLLGWYMVKSGLVNEPRVSQYRLLSHLMLAVLLLCLCFWHAWSLGTNAYLHRQPPPESMKTFGVVLFALFIVQVGSGAIMAGLKAGHVSDTFPKMLGSWIPPGLWVMNSTWENLFENVITVHFVHRWLGILCGMAGLWFYSRAIRTPFAGQYASALHLFVFLVLAQIALGILSIFLYVPTYLASAHQLNAILIIVVVLYLLRQFFPPSSRVA